MVNTFPKPTMPSGHTVAVFLAATAALAVAAAAFTRSFSALSDLAVMHQWPADQAWILPVALDGMIIVPTVAAVVRRDARWYAWSLLVAGTILSVAGNGIHAWLTAMSHIAVGLAVIPPVVTLTAVHLTIVVARAGSDTAAAETVTSPHETATDPCPTVSPDSHDKTRRDTDCDETPAPVTRLRVARATPAQPSETPVAATPRTPDRAATADVATVPVATRPATQQTLALDIATATDDEKRAEAIRRVVDKKHSVRATGAALGVSKDKVQRWVSQYRASVAAATAAV